MGAAATVATPEDFRNYRLQKETDYYISEKGFLDFVRESGAAPDATFQPHGRYCQRMIHWDGEPDPENPELILYKWKMTLWPRGSFKSAVFDCGMAAWEIAKDPNIRILVCSETDRQAKKFVQKTMEIVDSQWFKDHFGVHRGARWTPGSGAFTSALRSDDFRYRKEATLQATGVGAVQTGSHWDLVIMDDICSQENTRTPESIESLWFWFGETLAQLDPGCRLFVIGTLHHYNDIYCRILKDEAMRKLFDLSIHSWKADDGEIFFPERLTTKYVAGQKTLLPPRLFACFYENRPTTSERQIFKRDYFITIKEDDIPSEVWTYIFTDFAFIAEEKKTGRADRTVFWVVSLDCNRTAYVRDFYVGRWKPSDSVRIVCDLWNRYQYLNLKGVTLEDVAHKELLLSLFEEVRRQTFVHPKMIPIGGRSQEVKDMRIEAIEPRFRAGNIYFSETLKNDFYAQKWKPMITEMTEWPFTAHDDIPDAISDLDKRDPKLNTLYCPAPPAGWRSNKAFRHQPSMVDGKFNPDAKYPAREFVKAAQQGQNSWLKLSPQDRGDPPPGSQSIFKPQSSPPMPLKQFW